MKHRSISKVAAVAACAWLLNGSGLADDKVDYTSMNAEALAEYLIFDARGFDLDEQTQEGGTVRDRLTQDETQKACTALKGGAIDGETSGKVTVMARESVTYPKEGIKLGSWEKGEAVARSGFGYRVGHRVDDHGKRDPGGNCYACHELDPAEIAFGTLGPSLKGYGKARGTSEETLKYTYEVIYNPHSFFPCTHMPRFGASGILSEEQIRDVLAYLLDPESPVNR